MTFTRFDRVLWAGVLLAASAVAGGIVTQRGTQDDTLAGDAAAADGEGCAGLAAYIRPIAEREFSKPPVIVRALSPVRNALLAKPDDGALRTVDPGFPYDDDAGQYADIVRADGERVYAYGGKGADGKLRILDTSGGRLDVVGTLDLGDRGSGYLLLLPHHRVMVVGEADEWGPGRGTDGGALRRTRTDLTLVDVSDPARPAELRWDRVDGRILSAYERDGVVRVAVDSPAGITATKRDGETVEQARDRNLAAARAASGEDWLPHRVTRDGAGAVLADGPLLGCSDVTLPETDAGLGFASVLTIDPADDEDLGSAVGVAAPGQLAYSSPARTYVATLEKGEDWKTVRATGVTRLHAFDTSGRTARHVASGTVPGLVSRPDAFSARRGRLRVVLGPDDNTGLGVEGDSADRRGAAVLDEEGDRLRLVGSVSGVGRGDAVHGVLWLDDVAVVRTGAEHPSQVVIDVADPAAPRLAGRLKLPAWADALQPVGGRTVLAAGAEGTDARTALFDLSDPAAPVQVDRAELAPADLRTGTPDSFTWLPSLRLAVVTGEVLEDVGPPQCPLLNGRPSCSRSRTYSVGIVFDDHGRPQVVGHAETRGYTRRVVAAGDRVVVLSDRSLALLDPQGMRLLDSLTVELGPHGK